MILVSNKNQIGRFKYKNVEDAYISLTQDFEVVIIKNKIWEV